jgi:hypothetical protein
VERLSKPLLIVLAALILACGGRGTTAPTGAPPPGAIPPTPLPAPTPTPTPPPAPAPPTTTIDGLVLDPLFPYVFPAAQFKVAGPDACSEAHYHSDNPSVYSIGQLAGAFPLFEVLACHPSLEKAPPDFSDTSREVRVKTDPDRGGCGFGKVSEVRRFAWTITETCKANWESYWVSKS